jgi:hypothetical protein
MSSYTNRMPGVMLLLVAGLWMASCSSDDSNEAQQPSDKDAASRNDGADDLNDAASASDDAGNPVDAAAQDDDVRTTPNADAGPDASASDDAGTSMDATAQGDSATTAPNGDAGPDTLIPEIEGPITGPGDMFIDNLELGLSVSVADLKYVFEEYFVSGVAAGSTYRVRLLLARPSPSGPSFSGHVIVEPKHAMGSPFVWYFTREYLAAHGHASVEITTFSATIESTLKGANAERYADLHVADDQASDIFAQVGQLLKSDKTPLPETKWLYMTGHSMAAAPAWHFMDTHHATHRLDNGGPIYDGFFPETSASAGQLGPFPDVDVPTIQFYSESEVQGVIIGMGIDYRKPDSDDPKKPFRLYEVAGMMHNPSWMNPAVLAGGIESTCDQPLNRFPYNPTVSMGLDHLIRWVADGTVPPHAEPIKVTTVSDGTKAIDRDENDNALGGVRSATLDVPTASRGSSNSGGSLCSMFGNQHDFSKEKLASLYGDHESYVEQVNERLDKLIKDGWFLEEFAPQIRTEAEEFTGFE